MKWLTLASKIYDLPQRSNRLVVQIGVPPAPFARFVRIEIEQGSSLPVKLEKAGHRLHHAGMTTRIDGGKFHTVDVLELDMGR